MRLRRSGPSSEIRQSPAASIFRANASLRAAVPHSEMRTKIEQNIQPATLPPGDVREGSVSDGGRHMTRALLFGMTAATALVTASAAGAHDFFLLPEQFRAPSSGVVKMQATVGSSFPTPEIAVTTHRLERVHAIGPGNPLVWIAGAGAKALNMEVIGARSGLTAVAVTSRPRDVEYGEDRIPLILEEYRVLPEAAAAVEALPKPRTWQVVSRRFAKTFLCVQSCRDRSAAEHSFGAQLEFIGRRSGNGHFQLLALGRPLGNYPVDLVNSNGERQHLTTDARGEVHLPADARGTLMLFAAKLEPPAGQGRFTLDLTSLTFSRTQ